MGASICLHLTLPPNPEVEAASVCLPFSACCMCMYACTVRPQGFEPSHALGLSTGVGASLPLVWVGLVKAHVAPRLTGRITKTTLETQLQLDARPCAVSLGKAPFQSFLLNEQLHTLFSQRRKPSW